MYEAVTHAHNRVLYGKPGHRLPARAAGVGRRLRRGCSRMKLFSDRAVDYFRTASPDDRRYLLFNPITKMKVTTEGEKVIDLLWDVDRGQGLREGHLLRAGGRRHPRPAEARGHGPRQPRAGPEVHAGNYLFAPGRVRRPCRPASTPPTTRSSSRRARPAAWARSASTTGAPPTTRYAQVPNVAALHASRPTRSASSLTTRPPTRRSSSDLDLLLAVGQLFTLVVYGQLILEQARLTGLDERRARRLFDVLVRDFSAHAVELHGKASATEAAAELGAGRGAPPGGRRGALRARLGAGRGAVRRLRDGPLVNAVALRAT